MTAKKIDQTFYTAHTEKMYVDNRVSGNISKCHLNSNYVIWYHGRCNCTHTHVAVKYWWNFFNLVLFFGCSIFAKLFHIKYLTVCFAHIKYVHIIFVLNCMRCIRAGEGRGVGGWGGFRKFPHIHKAFWQTRLIIYQKISFLPFQYIIYLYGCGER